MKCPKCDLSNSEDARFCIRCSEPLSETGQLHFTKTINTPLEKLSTGSFFDDRYQIIEELGVGGMGKVYKVLDSEINTKVALKLIRPEIAADENTIERFRNELKIAREISHKNVCRMFDLNKEAGNYYITMEYVSGGDLKRLIKRTGPLTVGKAVVVAKQICEGLSEAHRLGVVHRDLKPNNIMIDDNGSVRIMDFGIARSVQGKGITGSGIMIGTPAYMSPEQVEAKGVDQRSDIYSLGIILYEMLTGRTPFEGETPLSIAMKHKGEMPKDPSETNAQIPGELSRLVLLCLEKDKESRIQSAEELLSGLLEIEKDMSTAEKALSVKKHEKVKTPKLSSKKLILLASAAVIVLGFVVFLGIILIGGNGERITSIAVLPFENVNEDPEMEYLSDGLTESLIHRLSQLPDLKVISRFSVLQYKGITPDLEMLGHELKVEAVLTGGITKRGEELKINTELVKVKDNSHIWGAQYDRNISEIFVIQDEISQEISDKLRLRLKGEEKKLLVKHYTENTEAYTLYLQGRFHWNRRTPSDLERAISYFEKAVAVDPQFALGYAGLAETYAVIGTIGLDRPDIVFPKVEEFSLKALELDGNLAEAHAALAVVKHVWNWDFKGAEVEFKKAIALNPNYATAYQWLAELYASTSNDLDTALDYIRKAQELDPHSMVMKAIEAQIYLVQKKYDLAIRIIEPVVVENPDFFIARLDLLHAFLGKKDYAKAMQTAEGFTMPGNGEFAKLRVFAAQGEMEKARSLFQEFFKIIQEGYCPPAIIATAYGDIGEIDEAFRMFDEAYEERSPTLFSLDVFPPSLAVRQDPRYKELMKKIGKN